MLPVSERERKKLTVSELARAVGKADSFVRQHIRRGHLMAAKDGARTFIEPSEAVRWSRERGLPFALPESVSPAAGTSPRAARMTAIVRLKGDGKADNVYTLIRHRRADVLGPWAGPDQGTWMREDIGHGLSRLRLSATFEHCRKLAEEAIERGLVELAGIDCQFDLISNPRRHRTFQDERPDADAARSPFRAHSAEVLEYWASESDGRVALTQAIEDLPADFKLKVPSASDAEIWPDRIGNLVIAGAQDTHTFDLHVDGFCSMTFHASGDGLFRGSYRAVVWASHCRDEVLRREFAVEAGNTRFLLPCNPDRIGYAVHRVSDGQCVDLSDSYLAVSITIDGAMLGPSLHITDKRRRRIHTIARSTSRSRIKVDGDQNAPEFDRIIRRRSLQGRAAESDTAAKRAGNVLRFGPHDFSKAVDRLIALVSRDGGSGAVYLADRYFASRVPGIAGFRLYADLLATSHDQLNVLCTEEPAKHPNPWWEGLPPHLTERLTVRSFQNHDRKTPAFHDRYLVAAERETLFTNSVHGWQKDGVTFVTLPFDVYRSETAHMWSQPLQTTSADFWVEEYPR